MLVHAGVKERARMKESADAMYGMTPSPHYYNYYGNIQYTTACFTKGIRRPPPVDP